MLSRAIATTSRARSCRSTVYNCGNGPVGVQFCEWGLCSVLGTVVGLLFSPPMFSSEEGYHVLKSSVSELLIRGVPQRRCLTREIGSFSQIGGLVLPLPVVEEDHGHESRVMLTRFDVGVPAVGLIPTPTPALSRYSNSHSSSISSLPLPRPGPAAVAPSCVPPASCFSSAAGTLTVTVADSALNLNWGCGTPLLPV